MRLVEFRVRNFRSIEAEQHLPVPGQMTLVGPNNSGKTNLLRATQVLFTGYGNTHGYTRETDLTFGVGKSRTSITATFDGDPGVEPGVYSALDELHDLQGTSRSGTLVSLNLYFTEKNNPVYSFFPNIKRPKAGPKAAQYSRTHIALVNRVLQGFSLHYVPSAKSVRQIYLDLLAPFLRRKVSRVLEPHLPEIKNSLDEAGEALNKELSDCGLGEYSASFSLPGESVEELVAGFDFLVADPTQTPIQEKGMGVQTTALLAAFKWITQQEAEDGYEVIWLLEEPESYLHPTLAVNCSTLLENLAKDSTVIRTTHSMAFVPQDPSLVRGTQLNEGNRTEIVEYGSYSEATSSIRESLGIRFGDFYNLAGLNVFVEGASDRKLLNWILDVVPVASHELPLVRAARFEDFGGVKHMSGFMRATYQFIRKECPCIALFDGDDAGEKEWRALQNYFGNVGIPFQSNEHFVVVRSRFPIEGLFPDQWLKDAYVEHPGWFDSFAVDAAGKLEPFRTKDSRKSNLQNFLIARANSESDLSWATRFVAVLEALDAALERRKGELA